jgi:hypothetical protein
MAGRPQHEGVAVKPIFGGRLVWLVLLAPLASMPSACTVEPGYGYGSGYGPGYEGGANIGFGVDYYEPFGFDYGGWGPDYRSGPPRGGQRTFRDGGRGATHAYRPAPSSRAMPSIPSGPRGGGRGGGGGRR